jgi:eukaryotic-like serine/threonine-protein kinase
VSLAPGTRLGPYEVVAPIGAGGMGEVYRARDTRLERDVALKVLPPSAASSQDRRQRFEREAHLISQLSHPHICALYDVGAEGTIAYLVMELLEGETLAHRLGTGPLPLEQVVRAGIEICSALEAAHAKGIVHRDLKPANVMLTGAGVKLLDFGLAKALEKSGPLLSDLPTIAEARTETGAVLGTLQYMSPEQLEGRPLDARTDIFALGAILYEMTTGKTAFPAASQASLISAILTSEPPPMASLQPITPPALDRLVKTCLAKDPARRFWSAHDVGLQLASLGAAASDARPAPAMEHRSRKAPWAAPWLPWLVAGLAAAVAVASLLKPRSAPVTEETSEQAIRFLVPPPPNGRFMSSTEASYMAVSPDGTQLAYAAAQDGVQRIWIREVSALEPRSLPGTDDAHSLFFSPDGGSIAFFAAGVLKRIDTAKGSAVPICDTKLPGQRAGSWGSRGDILFSSAPRLSEAIYRVPASGGTPAPAVQIDRARGELGIGWPRFLPDGERFLYLVVREGGAGTLMLFTPGKPPRSVMPAQSLVEYAEPGYLVYAHEGSLLGRRFDQATGRADGAPFSIAPRIRYFLPTGTASFAVSRSGLLLYQPLQDAQRLVWYDRSGRELATVGEPGGYQHLALSASGRRLLVDRTRPELGDQDVYAIDLERGTEERLVAGPLSDSGPIWLPGEKSIVYSEPRLGPPELRRRELATSRDEELLPPGGFRQAEDVSPDGRTLVYRERAADRSWWNLWALPLDGDRQPRLLVSRAYSGRFSPDGSLLAYLSLESNQREAYVTPFPGPGERTRLSPGGALALAWGEGRELLYLSVDGSLLSVKVADQVGKPTKLFKLPGRQWLGFDVSADGKRILAIEPQIVADELPLTAVVGFTSELK